MIRADLNTRAPEQNKYENKPEENDLVKLFFLEIENLFFTKPSENMGLSGMGVGVEEAVHSLNYNNEQLKNRIIEQIELYSEFSKVFKYSVDVFFLEKYPRDTTIVEIKVDNNLTVEATRYVFK